MSSEIIYRIKAVKFTAKQYGHDETFYCVLIEAGSSNCYECRTGRRSRDWCAFAIGEQWRIMQDICELAGGCEGGGVKLDGRWVKPESMIRAFRKALEQAYDGFTAAALDGFTIAPRIRLSDKDIANGAKHKFDRLSKAKEGTDDTQYGESFKVFRLDRNNPDDLALWVENVHGAGWNNAEVSGPRD